MTVQLPEELERYIQNEVRCGHFRSEQDAIAEAVRLLRESELDRRSVQKPITEEQFERHLMATGFLSNAPRSPSLAIRRSFLPVPIEGEPLSETVIRERR